MIKMKNKVNNIKIPTLNNMGENGFGEYGLPIQLDGMADEVSMKMQFKMNRQLEKLKSNISMMMGTAFSNGFPAI